ncbi:Eukaryotic translation initiation factor 4G [Spatholobus suberectus]|nr:Eukaryotic translation initiation factor 4G [Spatholobus suberectus]
MSFNQSKSDKSDAVYRKSGRSASFSQQRGSSGGAYGKAGGGGGGAGPSPSLSSGWSFNQQRGSSGGAYGKAGSGGGSSGPCPSLSSGRRFNKKSNNNAQGEQSRVNPTPVNLADSNSTYAARNVPNGSHVQPQIHGGSDAPVTNATAEPSESAAVQRSTRPVPKAPTSQPSAMSSDPAAPPTPANDASKAFPFQFGSISPGFMNGMAIPARTSSAPLNIDEQKRHQAQHDSFRAATTVPTPPVPKQQAVKKDTGVADQSNNAGEVHAGTRTKKDTQVSPLPPASQMQKPSVIPLTGISMPMPYHQSQASVHFGGPNPQIQSQGKSSASLQMPLPIHLPIGSAAQVQQQVFVPSLQPHPIHPEGIMHQGQNMGFTPQIGPPLGHMGIGISPQYPPQQGGKFAGPCKTTPVKVTHPETNEELRLDKRADAYSDGGSSGSRPHSGTPSQSQPAQQSAASRPINYYPSTSYSTNSLFYPTPSSLPLTSSQITPNSQPPSFNYAVSHGLQNVTFVNSSSHNSLPVNKAGTLKTTSKGKKKRKAILQKADATGSTSDLYSAYKGPVEKKETVVSSEKTERASTSGNLEQLPTDAAEPDATASAQYKQSKAELDDWEDVADMSTPKLEVSDKTEQVSDGSAVTVKKYSRDFLLKFAEQCTDLPKGSEITADRAEVSDGSAVTAKKYSRDFLLKFAEQCTDLPEGFEITADIAEALMSGIVSSHVIERDSHSSTGRIIDRSGSMSRMDRRGSGVIEEDKWSKVSNAFHSGMRLDGIGGNAGFRPGQGGNFGVLRNPRTQTPLQYAGGILSGPMQSMVNQGGMQRNSPDGERWQRATSFQQRGLIPSPSLQTPLQMMHKAEKKYEVGKVTDEEQAKQRQLKAILNKLTPQNFEKLFDQVRAVNIDNVVTLNGVISQIFEKALMEPTFCEMYANFCFHLAAALPDLSQNNEKITFKRLLLNKCQEEFERGEREQEEANKADEGEVKLSNEEREEKRTKARRRMLGNIRLIGELYKKKMLTERIMHECIKKLLGQSQDPDEEDIEALCKLMSTIGEMIDHPKAKEHMDAYFEMMRTFSINMNLSPRVRFMLKDAIDLRKNKWQQRRKVEGPKKIEEVHRDASQERLAQAGRLGRGPGNNPPRRTPMDFGPRGSSMLSPNSQMGGLRGLPTQVRGFGSQDVRMDDRQTYEARTLSVPLPQRPLGDESITLGPQGGLARGMSIRGPPAVSSSTGLNGYNNLPDRTSYSSREDPASRYTPDRFAGSTAYDQSSVQDRNMNYGNRDLRNANRILDIPVVNSPPARMQGTTVSQNTSSERPEDMSMAAIREYYSARDVNEVVLCIKDLNSPSFHPSMVSVWVTDSFERKDTERDLLAQLLVNLVKSQDGPLSQAQLIKGFESVLSTLEDAVNDAPKAPEFLGRVFAKAITEHVVSLKEIGRLIHEGGEEPGSLLEGGLAAAVLGSTLEVIKMENGDAVLSEICASSNLQLETFRPPAPLTSRKLEKFI